MIRERDGGGGHADLAMALKEARLARNESQTRFWGRFGVTQSRGSRFELGARIPSPVAILLKLYLAGAVSDGDLYRAKRRKSREANAQPKLGHVGANASSDVLSIGAVASIAD